MVCCRGNPMEVRMEMLSSGGWLSSADATGSLMGSGSKNEGTASGSAKSTHTPTHVHGHFTSLLLPLSLSLTHSHTHLYEHFSTSLIHTTESTELPNLIPSDYFTHFLQQFTSLTYYSRWYDNVC